MKMMLLFVAFSIGLLASCVMQSPNYTTIDQVMSLKVGMSKTQVEETLGVKPYDVKLYNDTGSVLIYIYRVIDRRTLSVNTKPVNGKRVIGMYKQLDISYSLQGKVISIETCRTCPDNLTSTSRINFEKTLMFITVSLPIILIYLGLK